MSWRTHRLSRRGVIASGAGGIAGLLAACAGPAQAPPTGKPAAGGREVLIKVSFGTDRNNVTRKMLDMLTEKKPNLRSELVERPSGAQQVYDYYATTFSSGDSSLDVVSIDVIWPTAFASANWVVPLNDVCPPDEQKKYLDSMIWAMTVQGKIYGIPWYNDIGNLYYRKELLDHAGAQPPKTWQDMVEIAKKLHKPPDLYGVAYTMRQGEQLMCNLPE